MAIVQANPAVLRATSSTFQPVAADLSAAAGLLGGALDDFRATAGWSAFLGDVPPLDIDLGTVAGRLDRMAAFTAEVAAAFEAADAVGADGRVRVDDVVIAARVATSFDELGPVLLRDGDRWIFPGTTDRDFVRVVADGAGYRLEVGVVVPGPGGRILDWRSMALTDDQAANLVIRTGGGDDDFVALPIAATIGFTVWTGAGNDVVGTPGATYSRASAVAAPTVCSSAPATTPSRQARATTSCTPAPATTTSTGREVTTGSWAATGTTSSTAAPATT
ncbi:MAG: hypothetical protein WKF93_12290 [Acidimicrobiales bacterium]